MRAGTVYTETVIYSARRHSRPKRHTRATAIVSLEAGGRVTVRIEGDRVTIGDLTVVESESRSGDAFFPESRKVGRIRSRSRLAKLHRLERSEARNRREIAVTMPHRHFMLDRNRSYQAIHRRSNGNALAAALPVDIGRREERSAGKTGCSQNRDRKKGPEEGIALRAGPQNLHNLLYYLRKRREPLQIYFPHLETRFSRRQHLDPDRGVNQDHSRAPGGSGVARRHFG